MTKKSRKDRHVFSFLAQPLCSYVSVTMQCLYLGFQSELHSFFLLIVVHFRQNFVHADYFVVPDTLIDLTFNLNSCEWLFWTRFINDTPSTCFESCHPPINFPVVCKYNNHHTVKLLFHIFHPISRRLNTKVSHIVIFPWWILLMKHSLNLSHYYR